jgi:hypothetical protein
MKLSRMLSTLEKKLVESTRFGDVMNWFYDQVAADPHFMDYGAAARQPRLEQMIGIVGQQLFPDSPLVELKDMVLVELPEHGFVHGSFAIRGRPASVIYFKGIEMGLLTVAMPGESKLIRFSTKALRSIPKPSQN